MCPLVVVPSEGRQQRPGDLGIRIGRGVLVDDRRSQRYEGRSGTRRLSGRR
jgi:hypothetical protein